MKPALSRPADDLASYFEDSSSDSESGSPGDWHEFGVDPAPLSPEPHVVSSGMMPVLSLYRRLLAQAQASSLPPAISGRLRPYALGLRPSTRANSYRNLTTGHEVEG